jgi:hypothetical protein
MAPDDAERPSGMELSLADDDELSQWEDLLPDEQHSLVELINRVLDKGVVISGDITISVAGVDLVYLSLSALLTSVSTARRVVDARIGGGGGARGREGEE